MTDSPDKRQADLDWLYGRDTSAGADKASDPAPADPPTRADERPAARPRIVSKPYDSADLPEPRRRPVAAPPRSENPDEPPPRTRTSPAGAPSTRPARTRDARGARDASTPAGAQRLEQARPRRRTRRGVRLLRLPLLVLVLALVWLIGVPVHALGEMASVDQSTSTDRPAGQPGTAILLVGNDARPDTGEGEAIGQRADTIMLLYRPRSGRSVLVSLPRDSLVTIPGYGQDKLNSAYAYGGPALLSDTVEAATGVRIDGYLEIGFDSFTELVDAVGGVDACPEFPLVDPDTGLNVEPGCQLLNGEAALAYVRMRYEDPRGDIGRAERQREIIGKIVSKAASPASVLNPVRYWELTHSLAAILTSGDETSVFDLAGGGLALMDVSKGEGLSLVVPVADPAGWANGMSVVIWDEAAAAEMFGEIAAGDTTNLDRFVG